MNELFKKNLKNAFLILTILTTFVFSYYLIRFISNKPVKKDVVKEPITAPTVEERDEVSFINFSEFGVVHIELDSPSYAKSNFDINPQTSITLYFNDRVDAQHINDNIFRLVNKNSDNSVVMSKSTTEYRDASDNKTTYTYKWEEVWQQKIVFTPSTKLDPVTMYEVVLVPGYSNESENKTVTKTFRFEFLTADDPGVLSTNLDSRGFKVDKGEEIKVIFKSPMSKEELVEKVRVYPEVAGLKIDMIDKIMTIKADFVKRGYQLSVPASTKDIYGRELGSEYLVSFDVL